MVADGEHGDAHLLGVEEELVDRLAVHRARPLVDQRKRRLVVVHPHPRQPLLLPAAQHRVPVLHRVQAEAILVQPRLQAYGGQQLPRLGP